jgi:hypothetical protein
MCYTFNYQYIINIFFLNIADMINNNCLVKIFTQKK